MSNHDTQGALVAEPAVEQLDGGADTAQDVQIQADQPAQCDICGAAPDTDGLTLHSDDCANKPTATTAALDDASFVLALFGVNPAKWFEGGQLNRAGLEASVDAYRSLYANRVLQGRHV